MSLLRVSGLRCHIRTSQISQLARRGGLASRARHYSDDADSSTWDPRKALCSPVDWNLAEGKHSFVVRRPGLFTISKDVLEAMKKSKPIVGLETAIYTHGFPKPNNYDLALEMEATVRDHGAIPATIGILNGRIMIGMTSEQLRELAESAGSENTHKISRRDLTYHISASGPPLNGGTTIAGTILLSRIAGIRVIATGGLGGVHKGGENSLDISADLTELSRNTVAVVTSGMKSFLDTPRTLEFLETQGVFVSTFGKKTEKVDIPGFFSRESGHPSPYIVESPEEAAHILFANHRLGLDSGNLYFNPIPEEYEIPKSEMDPIIAAAVESSSSVTGKDNTPAVLAEIVKQTEGRSMEANRRLVLENAKIGAQMAVEFSKLWEEHKRLRKQNNEGNPPNNKRKKSNTKAKGPSGQESKSSARENSPPATDSIINGTNGVLRTATLNPRASTKWELVPDRRSFSTLNNQPNIRAPGDEAKTGAIPKYNEDPTLAKEQNPPRFEAITEAPKSGATEVISQNSVILVVGGVGIDVVGKSNARVPQLRASNPGVVTYSIGGVAKNIAATLRQLDPPVPIKFLSAVGKDMNGIAVLQGLQRLGISTKDITINEEARTACYAAINSDGVEGGLSAAIADMDVIKSIPGTSIVAAIENCKPKIVCFDGNLDTGAMKALCIAAKAQGALVVCEPTSAPKSKHIASMLAELELEVDHPIDIISPNFDELDGILETINSKLPTSKENSKITELQAQESFHKYQTILKSQKNILSRTGDLIRSAGSKCVQPSDPTKLVECINKSIKLLHLAPTVITKLGREGVVIVRSVQHPNPAEAATGSRYPFHQNVRNEMEYDKELTKEDKIVLDLFLPMVPYDPVDRIIGIHVFWAPAVKVLEPEEVVSSNGAGDTFLGAFLHSLLNKNTWASGSIIASPWEYLQDEQVEILVRKAQLAAVQTLKSSESHPVRNKAAQESQKRQQEEKIWANTKDAFEASEETAERH
ncbi:hypothetical protein TWF506_003353 [Arthrobotrys conoides]|uniref:Carbohydrate kinase PfkB domain-containing protein n=1 Tax=Arthrobotrys conoides TaxID=74498 RepID=A0AAN8N7B1_9PEZI